MRLFTVVAVALAFSWMGAAADAACPKNPKLRLASTSRAVVWNEADRTFGCLRSTGRRVVLSSDSDEQVVRARVAGRFVAFGVDDYDKYDDTVYLGRVELWDLRSRRRVRLLTDRIPAGYNPVLRDMELRATGSAACMITTNDGAEVWLLAASALRRVDRAATIDPKSLRRSATRAMWKNGDSRRSVRLP